MSGGHFDYDQFRIGRIADEIETLIENNERDDLNEWGETVGRHYAPEIIERFGHAVKFLRIAQVYAQRVDWLVSGDDGPEQFLRRLDADLMGLVGDEK